VRSKKWSASRLPTAWRRRVGDWRIFFDVYPEQRLVDIVDIHRRTTTTYRQR